MKFKEFDKYDNISCAIFSGDVRAAYYIARWVIRKHGCEVREERGGYLPGHRAIALGRAIEEIAKIDAGRYLASSVEMAYIASRTL